MTTSILANMPMGPDMMRRSLLILPLALACSSPESDQPTVGAKGVEVESTGQTSKQPGGALERHPNGIAFTYENEYVESGGPPVATTADPYARGYTDDDLTPRVQELAQGVFSYEQLRSAGDERFTTVSLFVGLETDEGVLVADGQGNVEETARMVETIAGITLIDRPITHVVICSCLRPAHVVRLSRPHHGPESERTAATRHRSWGFPCAGHHSRRAGKGRGASSG